MSDQRSFSSKDWERISAAERAAVNARELASVLRLFNELASITDGFELNQQEHARIMAYMAAREGGSDELVLVALVHDIAKPLSLVNHPAVAAQIFKPRISDHAYLLIKWHSVFLDAEIHHHGQYPELAPSYSSFRADASLLARWDARAVDSGLAKMTLKEARERISAIYNEGKPSG